MDPNYWYGQDLMSKTDAIFKKLGTKYSSIFHIIKKVVEADSDLVKSLEEEEKKEKDAPVRIQHTNSVIARLSSDISFYENPASYDQKIRRAGDEFEALEKRINIEKKELDGPSTGYWNRSLREKDIDSLIRRLREKDASIEALEAQEKFVLDTPEGKKAIEIKLVELRKELEIQENFLAENEKYLKESPGNQVKLKADLNKLWANF